MKQFKIIIAVLAAFAAFGCQKPVTPEADNKNELAALRCYVYYDAADLGQKAEVNVLSGTYNPDKGVASFTFPEDAEKYNAESLKRCRLEASIPATATIVETDAAGKSLGRGIGEFRDLSVDRTTVYFKVVAANGDAKSYQITFRYKKN